MAQLKNLLLPGETELLREGRSVFMILAWMIAPAAPLVLVIWLMSYEGFYIEDTRTEYYGESTFVPQPVHH